MIFMGINTKVRAVERSRIFRGGELLSLGIRASEATSIDGVWAYWRNFSVSQLGRGHVIRNVQIALMHVLFQVFMEGVTSHHCHPLYPPLRKQ